MTDTATTAKALSDRIRREIEGNYWFAAIDALQELLALPLSHHVLGVAWGMLGTCCMNIGRAPEAALAYETAYEMRDESARRTTLENIIFSKDHCEDTTLEYAHSLRRRFWNSYGRPLYNQYRAPHNNDRDPERPLRVGYVSGDFRYHSANALFNKTILRHTEGYQAFVYSTAPRDLDDAFTTLYSQFAVLRHFPPAEQPSFGVTPASRQDEDDDILAKAIRQDRIDVLVDLSAYTNHGRMTLFARKPAPVQVTAWGYVLGTGLDTMDAILGDPVAIPHSEQDFYSEKIVHLPCIVPFTASHLAPEVAVSPHLCGQPFTFGCFARPSKIGAHILPLWRRTLEAVPDSRLFLKDAWIGSPWHRDRVLKALGVDPSRVIFGEQTAQRAHLGAYGHMDLQLDPYPIAGGVSALEGFWQGVPAIVRRAPEKSRVVSRVSLSAATVLGMDDFIAADDDEYVRLAVAWATERKGDLAHYWRPNLRALILNSPLAVGYVEAVENAYRELWRAWCKG